MWGGSRVSVILPAFNEEANVGEAVADFERCDYVDEIVVVDNNSTDGTAARVAATSARLVRETRQGLGWALRRGLEEATGDYLILAEPDGTFLARDTLKLLAYADDAGAPLGRGKHGVVPAPREHPRREDARGPARRPLALRLRLHAPAHRP